jgi:phosphomannomutase / phosphoglucomutase
MNPHMFREYDIRGVFEKDLTEESVTTLGRALGTYAIQRQKTRLALGRDCRLSSPVIRDWLSAGLVDAGVTVVDLGVVPTPLAYFSIPHLKTDGSIMITGSHNPPEYNGFKITLGTSSLFGSQIQEVLGLIQADELMSGGAAAGATIELYPTMVEEYMETVLENIKPGARRPKVILDAGNGTGGVIARPLFERMGFDVECMFEEMDGTFPNHHPDPSEEENLVALQARVRETGADLGIAYDGDADRAGVIDNKGDVIWGDRLLVVLARAVLKDNPGAAIVGEVKCSRVLFDEIEKAGGRAIMGRVGHSLIKARMKEEGALLAGEMSGHIFYKHRWYGFDDAIYTSARLLEILSHTEASVSDLLADVPQTHVTPETRVDCPDELKFAVVERITEAYRVQGDKVNDIDGVRFERDNGWGLVRASNTSPVVVMRAEGTSQAALDGIWSELRGKVEAAIASAAS